MMRKSLEKMFNTQYNKKKFDEGENTKEWEIVKEVKSDRKMFPSKYIALIRRSGMRIEGKLTT
jgi:hypothetical protein